MADALASGASDRKVVGVQVPPRAPETATSESAYSCNRVESLDDKNIPVEFDAVLYRTRHADLGHLTEEQLLEHYEAHGMDEGRCASAIESRVHFFSLIPESSTALEIGPFNNPCVQGPNVRYFDTLSTDGLRRRATEIGIDQTRIPEIHYVDPNGDLSIVKEQFDYCVSSHAIEHQPDLVRHLVAVSNLLAPGGRYMLAVPDRRYTFDHFIKDSNIAEVVEAHQQRRTVHTLQSVIEHRALTTHNDPALHWQGEHGTSEIDPSRVLSAVEEFEKTEGYLDVHAWLFTPKSFRLVIDALSSLGLIAMTIERIFPTLRGSNEFYSVLRQI